MIGYIVVPSWMYSSKVLYFEKFVIFWSLIYCLRFSHCSKSNGPSKSSSLILMEIFRRNAMSKVKRATKHGNHRWQEDHKKVLILLQEQVKFHSCYLVLQFYLNQFSWMPRKDPLSFWLEIHCLSNSLWKASFGHFHRCNFSGTIINQENNYLILFKSLLSKLFYKTLHRGLHGLFYDQKTPLRVTNK